MKKSSQTGQPTFDVDFSTYKKFINFVVEEVRASNPHVLALFRGSLPMSTHVSNILDCPLSIGKFQKYNGNDKEFKLIFNNEISSSQTIVIIDDLEDSGETIRNARDYCFKNFPHAKVRTIVMYGYKQSDIENFLEKPDKWIRFWWEM